MIIIYHTYTGPTYYSECTCYNLRKFETKLFAKKFREMYTKMNLLSENECHYSYLFDAVRKNAQTILVI